MFDNKEGMLDVDCTKNIRVGRLSLNQHVRYRLNRGKLRFDLSIRSPHVSDNSKLTWSFLRDNETHRLPVSHGRRLAYDLRLNHTF